MAIDMSPTPKTGRCCSLTDADRGKVRDYATTPAAGKRG
jgi:hypothetical protein